MPESFLILLSGGVLLATAIPKPRDITLQWLRLGGIISLTMLGLSAFFFSRRAIPPEALQVALYIAVCAAIAAHLVLVQIARPVIARPAAVVAFAGAVVMGARLLGRTSAPPMAGVIACAGVASMVGMVLMEMLLGHAYLTASKMTMEPFKRMNFVMGAFLLLRIFLALCAILMEQRWPQELFWAREGLLIGIRWLVGLLVPAIFIYMTHDCIKRRATQSATGILYVAGVLVFIGELIALNLTRETGLPF